jgi:hypothetical protein
VKSPIGSFSTVATPTRIAEPAAGGLLVEHGAGTPAQLATLPEEPELLAVEEPPPEAPELVLLSLAELPQAPSAMASAVADAIHKPRLRFVGSVPLPGRFIDECHLRVRYRDR